MNLKQLEYFVRVAELGSFTRASQALDIAQPALSRQVRQLEVELRQSLLTRNGRGAVPTEAGELLLAHGRGILHQVRRAREEMAQVRGELAGRPGRGGSTTQHRQGADRAVDPGISTAHGAASLSIGEGLSVALAGDLVNGRLDIALLYNAAPSPDLELSPLQEEALFLVQRKPAAGTSEKKPRAALPLVIPSRPNAIRMLVEAATQRAMLELIRQTAIDPLKSTEKRSVKP